MSELEELRQRRMRELLAREQAQRDVQEQVQYQMQEQEVERQIHYIITQILSPEARERLGNIRIARAQFARQIEVLLIQLYQAGKLPSRISDEQFKAILTQLKGRQRDTKISHN